VDFLLTAGKILFFIFIIVNIALILKRERGNFSFAKQVWQQFRFGMFVQCFLLLVLTVVVGVLLSVYVPGLKYGWLHLFVSGGGNVLITPVTDASSSDYLLLRLVPIAFFLTLLVAVPFLARAEEKMFREGYTEWKNIWWQSIKFGLIHCVVGIPISFGIALIVPGLFFAHHYKKAFENKIDTLGYPRAQHEAVIVSTTYHSMYNSIALTIGFVISVIMV